MEYDYPCTLYKLQLHLRNFDIWNNKKEQNECNNNNTIYPTWRNHLESSFTGIKKMIEKRENLYCVQKHSMKKSIVILDDPIIECYACKKIVHLKEEIWRCGECDHDFCVVCCMMICICIVKLLQKKTSD